MTNAAIVYTVCVRANDQLGFHTDTAVANRSGLRAHTGDGRGDAGEGRLSCIIQSEDAGDPGRIARISCRFGTIVFMPIYNLRS